MSWQLLPVGLIIAAAAAYLARQTWRAWRGSSSGCAGGCPKCTSGPPSVESPVVHIPSSQLTLRRR
jgi:hypothetical protein